MINSKGLTRRGTLRAVGGTVVGSTLVSGATDIATGQSDESWPQLGYDDANTGHAPQNTGPAEDIQLEWTKEDVATGTTEPSVVVADGTVYFNSRNNVYALDAEDGTEQWAYEAGNGVSSPVVADGTVYIGSLDNNVYALDIEDGTEQWVYETYEERGGIRGAVHTSPAVADSTVYVRSNDNGFYALDAEDGTELWVFEASTGSYSTPAVLNNTVYIGIENSLYRLDAEDGTEQWTYEMDGETYSSPAVRNGIVYVGDNMPCFAVD